ncbi:MAG: glycosyltransferase [Candidatus Bathyarchaeota archaeon]|nr:glycosyltransferase [Candidatus Bathyarchaeota archaeon]
MDESPDKSIESVDNSVTSNAHSTISCIVIVRNMVGTIRKCLESLLKERIDQIIVVDGHSTDGTSQVVDLFPVTHLYDHGKGVPAARNIGLFASTAEYILIVDADQWLPSEFIEKLRNHLNKSNCDAVTCDEIWSGSSIWARAQEASWTQVAYFRNNWIYWPRLMRKSLICAVGGWDENLKGFEDLDLWNRIVAFNPRTLRANLKIYSNADDITVVSALKRGIYSHVSLPVYIARYPSQWQKVLSVAPIGFGVDFVLSLGVLVTTKDLKIAVASFVLRASMSIGRFVGVCLHRFTKEIARYPRTIR